MRPRSGSEGGIDARHWLLAVQGVCVIVGLIASDFSYDPDVAVGLLVGATVLLFASRWLARGDLPAVGFLLQSYVLLLTSAVLVSALCCMLSATGAAYVDDLLIDLDHRLFGFSWIEVSAFFSRQPAATTLLSIVYSSLAWQPFVLLGLFAFRNQQREARQFTLAWLFASTICIVPLLFAPALGGYVHYGTEPADYPSVLVHAAWDFEPVLTAVRDGRLRQLGENPIVGIVTFPSFHAAGAAMLALCGRRVAGGIVLLGCNAAMLVSTVPIGGHYLIDVVAGVLVTVLALAGATFLADRPGRHGTLSEFAIALRTPKLAEPQN